MVGNPSNRKVARAARTSSGRRRNASAPIGWYTTLTIICVLGASLVFFSRQDRLDATNPGSTPPLAPVVDAQGNVSRPGDNWLEAYGVYLCDKFAPAINSTNNPYGISTQNDGIIHVSPFEKKYAGHNAQVNLFAKAVDLKVSRTSVQLPNDPKVWKAGEKCGDKNGKFVVKEWTDAKNPETGKEVKSDPDRLLLKNNAAVVFAYIPEDKDVKDIPAPDSVKQLDAAAAAIASGNTTSAGAGTTETTAPAAPGTTAPASPATTAAP
jgi:hypothetical protein